MREEHCPEMLSTWTGSAKPVVRRRGGGGDLMGVPTYRRPNRRVSV